MFSPTLFADPSAEYRIKPFWFWNSRLEKSELLRQVGDMRDKGIGGFFIHARFGLETEYMSDAWFDAVLLCVEEAERLGMEVWLYDENPFPSGIAGLKVSSRREYRNRYMECSEVTLKPGVNVIVAGDCKVPAVCRIPYGLPLAAEYADGSLTVLNPSGEEVRAAVYSLRIVDNPNGKIFGIDYMNPEAVRLFIELTHEKYAQKLGRYFGTVIKGVFTDEPTLLPWHQDLNWYIARKDGRVLAWDENIFPLMRAAGGYEPARILTALFCGTGDEDGSVRKLYWKIVSGLYEENFFKQYAEWCRGHSLLLTGHVLLEEGLYFNHLFQGDILKNLRHFDIPGTDQLCSFAEQPDMSYMVGNAVHLPKMKTNVQGPKTVSSAAHLSGRNRILSESFGLGGWALNPQSMKRIVDWEYALGINQLCVHAFFYSIEGFRKYDAPPCHMHNTFWPLYKIFADYTARLSYALSCGKDASHAAVLYPLSAFRACYVPGFQRDEDKRISDVYDLLCAGLMKLHCGYDIIGEHHLGDCAAEDGALLIADRSYDVLFVPSMKALDDAAAEKIASFTASGGRILVFNGSDPGSVPVLDLDDREDLARFESALEDFVVSCGAADAVITGGGSRDIRCLHRTGDDGDIYFFANTSEKTVSAAISVGACGGAAILDAEDGSIYGLACREERGRTCFTYAFGPLSSLLVVIGGKYGSCPPKKPAPAFSEAKTLDGPWRFHIEGMNVFPLEGWTFNVRVFTFGSEFVYKNTFTAEKKPGRLMLLLDDIEYRTAFMGLADVSVSLNGQPVPVSGESTVDKKFRLADLTDTTREGENSLDIVIKHSPWSGEPHLLTSPVKILGDFGVSEKDGKPVIGEAVPLMNTGSWTGQGYPYYSGTGVYACDLYFGEKPSAAVIELTDIADAAEIIVNGKSAAVRLWKPWTADISELVSAGSNSLEIRVTNSMVNFMQNERKHSGLTGSVKIYYS